MPKTVDPVFSSSVLAAADLATALDIDALTQSLAGLEGKVDKNPKTAAIILAGGTGERFGKRKAASSWWKSAASRSSPGRSRPSTP